MGGALGAAYNDGVRRLNLRRRGLLLNRTSHRVAVLRLVEAVGVSLLCFTVYYALPWAFSCRPCPGGSKCEEPSAGGVASSGSSSASASAHGDVVGGDEAPPGLSHLEYVRFNCAAHEHNEMATLMQSGQEGMLKHLYMRSAGDDASEPTLACCATLLAVYFVLAVTMFGVGLPAGKQVLLSK